MNFEARPYQPPLKKGVRLGKGTIPLVMALLMAASIARSQSQITQRQIIALKLGSDQIGIVKTAEKVSTRLAFREPIKEIICGDLYDPESGIGAFVVQRIDNDIFIKPVVSKGISNMFVKAGERGERIYNFSLLIVPIDQVYFIVNVTNATDNFASEKKISSQPKSLTVAPPIFTSIKMSNGDPDNATGSISGISLVKMPRLIGPEEPPPPPNMKLNSRPSSHVIKSESLSQREVVKRVKPDYPERARILNINGEVTVEISIDNSGKVTSAQAISGHDLLRNAAVSAARSWKFSPATSGDGPKQDTRRITFNFQNANF